MLSIDFSAADLACWAEERCPGRGAASWLALELQARDLDVEQRHVASWFHGNAPIPVEVRQTILLIAGGAPGGKT